MTVFEIRESLVRRSYFQDIVESNYRDCDDGVLYLISRVYISCAWRVSVYVCMCVYPCVLWDFLKESSSDEWGGACNSHVLKS